MSSYLTLDMATLSGFCNWTPGSMPVLSHSDLSTWYSHDYGKALAIHEKRLLKNIEKYEVTHICFEKPIKLRTDSLAKLRRIIGLSNIVELITSREGIACYEAPISQWRAHVLGDGKMKKDPAKAMAIKIAIGCGFDPKCDDEAEAFCIMDYLADTLKLKKDWPEPFVLRMRGT